MPLSKIEQSSVNSGVAGTGPAFSAYFTGSQTINDNVSTKVILNNETFDTNSCFDSTTNYRFTPNVAGYYSITGTVYLSTPSNYVTAQLGKNGSIIKVGAQAGNGAYLYGSTVTDTVYLNGTTDYVELYIYQGTGTSKSLSSGSLYNYFSGFMVRGA